MIEVIKRQSVPIVAMALLGWALGLLPIPEMLAGIWTGMGYMIAFAEWRDYRLRQVIADLEADRITPAQAADRRVAITGKETPDAY